MYQLFKQGVGQIDWKFFTTLPTTPTLIDPNDTGGISNAIVGTIALTIYASIMAIPLGVLVGVYLAETSVQVGHHAPRDIADDGGRAVHIDGTLRFFTHRARP